MVATQNSYPGWIADLEGNQKRHRFHRVIASIHIVTHEKIICVWNFPSNSKQLHQVMELTVYVSTNGHWRLHWLDICFLYQNLLGLHTGMKIPRIAFNAFSHSRFTSSSRNCLHSLRISIHVSSSLTPRISSTLAIRQSLTMNTQTLCHVYYTHTSSGLHGPRAVANWIGEEATVVQSCCFTHY